ncbi:hypothetical protein GPALN_010296 [Globodera pallida]|nr:hypothetical protein GPALN_010296 [Globodera pallida]
MMFNLITVFLLLFTAFRQIAPEPYFRTTPCCMPCAKTYWACRTNCLENDAENMVCEINCHGDLSDCAKAKCGVPCRRPKFDPNDEPQLQ